MALEDVSRRVLHVANGTQTAFPFAFTIFDAGQVTVYRAESGEEEEVVVASEYTVAISTTGGTVTFRRAPAEGTIIAIISAIPYTQTMELTNYGGFNPETLNHNADLQAAQIQQLKEMLDRCVKLKPTDTITVSELEDGLSALVGLIKSMQSQLVAQDVVWTVTAPVASGAEVTLPQGLTYQPGAQHLHLYWNSLALARGRDFMEMGVYGTASNKITILFPLAEGDEMIARTVPNAS